MLSPWPESHIKAGRLTQREEHQERGRFLNVESMAGVTVMTGRLTQREEHQDRGRRGFLNVESMAGAQLKAGIGLPKEKSIRREEDS
jgi:hypothetical protein